MRNRDKRRPSQLSRGTTAPVCVYCGIRPGIEVEHVVAKQFFHTPPKAYIKVPACAECNRGRSDGGATPIEKDEEYMRNVLTMSLGAAKHVAAQAVFGGKVSRSFAYSPKIPASFIRAIKEVREVMNENGKMVELPRMKIDMPRIYRVVRKITKGLYYHLANEVLPAEYEVVYRPTRDKSEIPAFERHVLGDATPNYFVIGDENVFKFIAVQSEDPRMTQWLMVFYESFAVTSCTYPRAIAETIRSTSPALYDRVTAGGR